MAQLLNVRSLGIKTPASIESDNSNLQDFDDRSPQRNESTVTLFRSDNDSKNVADEVDKQKCDREHGSFQNPVFQDDIDEDESSVSRPYVFIDIRLSSKDLEVTEKKPSASPNSLVHIVKEIIHPKNKNSEVDDVFGSTGVYSTIGPSATQPVPPDKEKSVLSNGVYQKKCIDPDDSQESLLAICIQVFLPFLVAGIGTCGSGLILDKVEGWDVFKNVSEIFILVPTLLGLKGNLEMTLASRVSTQVNLDKLESVQEKWRMCWGNMALLQCQATVLSFLSSCFATVMRTTREKDFDIERALLLGGSALFTASLASLVLGAITLAVVLMSNRFRVNPDNVATPIAASLGDVTTLGILAAIASYLYEKKGDILHSSVCLSVFIALVPVWVFLAYRNDYVKKVLCFGWTPVIVAVAITSAGGYILEFSVNEFRGLAVFQPVINGVAGNLVAVQASRISTYFHQYCGSPGSMPPDGLPLCLSPVSAFFGKNIHARTARILLVMVIPGHLLFGYGITLIKGGDTVLTPTFLPIYLVSALLQVALLLYIAQCLIHLLWRWKVDPDNWAIPLLTALGDLSGMAALTTAFFLHRSLT